MNFIKDTATPWLLSLGCLWSGAAFAQVMTTNAYRDTSIAYIEQDPSKYNFAYPICADILTTTTYSPSNDGLYFKASYGHRYLSSRSTKTDNHGGFDYWSTITCDSVNYNSANKIAILCMCDGYISEVLNGPDSVLEQTSKGRSVQVTCDSLPQALGGNIVINYRHLSSLGSLASLADTMPANTVLIHKGDTIGIMGESGYTANVHLHLSAKAIHPLYGNTYIHTARLFDPTLYPNVLAPLHEAKIELLQNWSDRALFRIIWPYNQTINRFEFSNAAFSAVFDKEAAYDKGASIRDEHDCIAGFKVFAYQFNGKQTALTRYNSEKVNMPAVYPASPQRDTNLSLYHYVHIPIVYDSVAFVYDFLVENLPTGYDKDSFVVRLSDVWGNTVEGRLVALTTATALSNSSKILLYPNPASERTNLEFKDTMTKSVRILNLCGKEIYGTTTNATYMFFDLIELPTGIYFVQVVSERKNELLKLIKR
ncbi:T9SS type A sorting domain-containing protein [Aureispira anguillae]|uniref:T9SS type A sorting domain-containing protein n=1 Tax=Aureispira anguillae TaxID=2864201 RepID=A0A915YHA9_9BACT|nr:T9SS type A sorting domain-containing protein [Aureispira anguillae]BDS13154.1 T9SS type A sorting domain-containing protein [Aureispira anguillae]